MGIKNKNICKTQVLLLLSLMLLSGLTPAYKKIGGDEIVQFSVQVPNKIERGKTFRINVILTIQPSWYIYAPTGTNAAQGMIETKVVFNLPKGITSTEKLKLPAPVIKDGHAVYEGEGIVLSQSFQASSDLKPGFYQIKSRITWQTCNSEICLQPASEEISTRIQIKG